MFFIGFNVLDKLFLLERCCNPRKIKNAYTDDPMVKPNWQLQIW